MVDAVAQLPRHASTRQAVRLRARLRRRRLDDALAGGADPWSSPDLMLRASQLSSPAVRRETAATLEQLVGLAERNRPVMPRSQPRAFAPCLRIRCGVVLEHRDTLLALAARLREPAPVSVAVVATLAWLVRDESSPAYAGGNPPAGLADVVARCACALSRDSERL
jgi:hypothetical protein